MTKDEADDEELAATRAKVEQIRRLYKHSHRAPTANSEEKDAPAPEPPSDKAPAPKAQMKPLFGGW